MPLDAYSPCPCGTGKKIKFCCSDLLGELQKIDRMIEGEQYLGCLQHIEQLRQKYPDRASLMAIKGMLLRGTDQAEAAAASATEFLEKHPENPTALAEAAIATAAKEGNAREAMETLQRAIAATDGKVQDRLYEALGTVGMALINEGNWLSGRALLQLQLMIDQDNRQLLNTLVQLNRSPNVPLLLKDNSLLESPPDGTTWKDRFEEAISPAYMGNWLSAVGRLATLAEEFPDEPAIRRSIATLRGWLADTPGCIDALRKYAAMDVPLENAVEATATAMLLDDDPLGDLLDLFRIEWEVTDVDELRPGLTLEGRVMSLPVDPSYFADDDTPPKASYALFDRQAPETADVVELKDVPFFLGRVMLYGHQTDRRAKLEVVGVAADDIEQVKTILKETAGDTLADDAKQEVTGQVSATRRLLHSMMRPPEDISQEQFAALTDQHRRDVLLSRWPEMKLGVFDGQSPREVAEKGGRHIELSAAIMVLDYWCGQVQDGFDFNQLRTELGLPTLGPIDSEQNPIETLPLVRFARVTAQQLSDEDLIVGYRRATAFNVTAALQKFARAIIDRPSLSGNNEQLAAYRTLAQMEHDPDRALEYVHQGRAAAESAGQSPVSWLLFELSLQFSLGNTDEIGRLMGLIHDRHIEEPGVADALTQLLIQVGVLRPDGTPAGGPPQPMQEDAAGPTQAEEPGKIWTPDAEPSAAGGKIWTPD